MDACIKKLDNIDEEIPTEIIKNIFTTLSKEKVYSLLMNEIYKPFSKDEYTKIILTSNGNSLLKIEEFCESLLGAIGEIFDDDISNLQNCNKTSAFYIKKYIDKYYFKKIKLEMFSKEYYMSREHLTRCFKEEFGCGIYKYVLKVRMENAKKMLDNPNIKICNVADKVGYSDYNYFSKAFKKYFGISPSVCRIRHEN